MSVCLKRILLNSTLLLLLGFCLNSLDAVSSRVALRLLNRFIDPQGVLLSRAVVIVFINLEDCEISFPMLHKDVLQPKSFFVRKLAENNWKWLCFSATALNATYSYRNDGHHRYQSCFGSILKVLKNHSLKRDRQLPLLGINSTQSSFLH